MRLKLIVILIFTLSSLYAQEVQREIKINKKYLNIPIQSSQKRQKMVLKTKNSASQEFVIRLSNGQPDYWVFADVSDRLGKSIVITYPENSKGLDAIYLSDQIDGIDSLYHEKKRPQVHFTARRGWINDPNGLLFYKGEYHLFYQHNPYERDWGNMHWGHAISDDLLHWKELPDALYPDTMGSMFSGTANIDYGNTSGFQKGAENVMVLAYTNHGIGKEVQCLAYSNDMGRTLQKYKGNPVVVTKGRWSSPDTRDPKVFWHEASHKWVMVLFETEGMSVYNADDMKSWVYQSHIRGFWECPDLFQLPVDGNKDHSKWVIYGASGTYLIGSFDGKTFIPETDKLCYVHGNIYASQTFNNIPSSDGRRIQIGWGTIDQESKSFNNMMTFPTELTLRSTRDGIRMFSEPIREIEKLYGEVYRWNNLSVDEVNEKLKSVKGDCFFIKMKIELLKGSDYKLMMNGNVLVAYDMNKNILNTAYYGGDKIDNLTFYDEVLVDRTSIEVFADHGKFTTISPRQASKSSIGFEFGKGGSELKIHSVEIYVLKSIW